MTHVRGKWGTKFNVFFSERDVSLEIVQPQAPTRQFHFSHEDAQALGIALIGKNQPAATANALMIGAITTMRESGMDTASIHQIVRTASMDFDRARMRNAI